MDIGSRMYFIILGGESVPTIKIGHSDIVALTWLSCHSTFYLRACSSMCLNFFRWAAGKSSGGPWSGLDSTEHIWPALTCTRPNAKGFMSPHGGPLLPGVLSRVVVPSLLCRV